MAQVPGDDGFVLCHIGELLQPFPPAPAGPSSVLEILLPHALLSPQLRVSGALAVKWNRELLNPNVKTAL